MIRMTTKNERQSCNAGSNFEDGDMLGTAPGTGSTHVPIGAEVATTDPRNQGNMEFRVDIIEIDIVFFQSFS